MPRDHDAELGIAQRLAESDVPGAVGIVITAYGDEIYGFLVSELRSDTDASDAFSSFALDLLRGLPGVQIRTSMRGYAYQVARHAAGRQRRQESRERLARGPLDVDDAAEALLARVRTSTPAYRRTDVKDAFGRIRDTLEEDERRLLTLRVDRRLAWREIAEALSDAPAPDLDREASKLRKRYELLKRKLRRLAVAEGILEPE